MFEKYSVLFVDDELNILNALRRSLINEEYQCHFASNGKDALEIMEKEKFTVVVTDMRMPVMDGLALLKEIKVKWPRTVKIVLSGYMELQHILTTINEVDVFKYIAKPWKQDEELKAVILKALEYYKLQEENEEFKKILQNKNYAYQNIFKNIEETIASAKRSNELLGLCGKRILCFMKSFKCTDMIKHEYMLEIQEEIYGLFVAAAVGETGEYSYEALIETLLKSMQSQAKVAKVDNNTKGNGKVRTCKIIVQAVLSACIIVFKEEFTACGLHISFELKQDNKLTVSLVSPNAYAAHNAVKEDGLSILDTKVDYVNSVLGEVARMSNMTFCSTKTNGSIFTILTLG